MLSPICTLHMKGDCRSATRYLWGTVVHRCGGVCQLLLPYLPPHPNLPCGLLCLESSFCGEGREAGWRPRPGKPSWASLALCLIPEQPSHVPHTSSCPFCLWPIAGAQQFCSVPFPSSSCTGEREELAPGSRPARCPPAVRQSRPACAAVGRPPLLLPCCWRRLDSPRSRGMSHLT